MMQDGSKSNQQVVLQHAPGYPGAGAPRGGPQVLKSLLCLAIVMNKAVLIICFPITLNALLLGLGCMGSVSNIEGNF